MSDDENRDQGAGLPQQPLLQLNQQLSDGVATIVNRQKEEILRSVNEMVSTKLQKFEDPKESYQDLADSVNREIVDPYKLKKKGNEQQFLFNQKMSLKTASAVNSFKRNKIEQALEELQEGLHLITKSQKLIKLADKSEHGWATVNEYLDDELASDEEDARKIRKAEKSAEIKVQGKKKRENQRKSVFVSKNRPRPSLSNQQFSANLASRIPSTFFFRNLKTVPKPSDICFRCGGFGHWYKFCPGKSNSS